MIVHFSKYHGTGNDFIMIDGSKQDSSQFNNELIKQLCDRRFGIGGDGLIILEKGKNTALRMRYYNADGKEGTMCGNGGRCFIAFARSLDLTGLETQFEGIDGLHVATSLPNGDIRLKLKDVHSITPMEDGYLLDTGSPHFVKFVDQLDELDVAGLGKVIRHQERFGPGGVNVNFVELGASSDQIFVRTYERGVEAETYSCGTGVTAAAICASYQDKSAIFTYQIITRGGKLKVSFKVPEKEKFNEIYLIGPASRVYDGSIQLST